MLGPFGGCYEAVFAPVLSLSVPGLQESLGETDLLYLWGFHSLVLGRVAVFLLVDAGTVDTTRDAFVIEKGFHSQDG